MKSLISRGNLKSFGWLFLGLFTFAFPSSIKKINFRYATQPLHIQVYKMSPAFAALQDVRTSYQVQEEEKTISSSEALTSGVRAQLYHLIEDEEKPEQSWVKLKGMKVSQQAAHTQTMVAEVSKQKPVNLYDNKGYLLPVQARIDMLAKKYEDFHIEAETVSQKAKELVARELASVPQPLATAPGTVTLSNDPDILAAQRAKLSRRAKKNDSLAPKLKNTIDEFSNYLPYKNITISGSIEMINGMAYFGPKTYLEIFWESEGKAKQRAHVSVTDGTYEIVVDQLEGYLVAEYRSANGDLLGEAEVSLYDFKVKGPLGERIAGINLYIEPATDGLAVDLISGRSFGEITLLDEESQLYIDGLGRRIAKDENGSFQDGGFHRDSTFILKSRSDSHWTGIYVADARNQNIMKTYPAQMVDALLGLTASSVEDGGVIWGVVTRKGRAVSGAQVELGLDENRPIYFNKYIPDHKLEMTNQNGLFAFTGVVPGVQSIRVKYQNRHLLAQVIPIEYEGVTYVTLEIGQDRVAYLEIADANTGESVPAQINFIGSEEIYNYQPNHFDTVTYPGGKGLMWVEVDAGKAYHLTRKTVSRNSRSLIIPLVKSYLAQ